MKSNYIIGSGLVSLLCRKILGPDWKIIPFGPSRFYSNGIPALGDDFIYYDIDVLEIINNWGLNTSPLFYKRPLSISGSLLYNQMFIQDYLDRIGLPCDKLTKDYYKSDFTVFGFSCIQLWNKLLREFIDEIKVFHEDNKSKSIKSISDHTLILDNNKTIEYDNIISTIPYYALCKLLKIESNCGFLDLYFYFVQDDGIDIESANQTLICDREIFFHKCTKISKNKFLFEVIDQYYDDIQLEFSKIIGSNFEILKGAMVQNGHVLPSIINDKALINNGITCIGSHAQCDPLIDISSVIKRIRNLLNKNKIQS